MTIRVLTCVQHGTRTPTNRQLTYLFFSHNPNKEASPSSHPHSLSIPRQSKDKNTPGGPAAPSIPRDAHLHALHRPVLRRVPVDALSVQGLERLERRPVRQAVELLHLPVRELEVEHPAVLDHALPPHRLGDVDEAVLDAPPSEDLRRGLAVRPPDPGEGRVVHGLAVAERPVRLQHHALAPEVVDGVLPVEEGVDLDLVHDRPVRDAALDELLVVLDGVVRHADVPHLPLGLEPFQSLVGLDVLPRHRPVDQVQVDVVRPEVGQGPLELGPYCPVPLLDGRGPDLAAEEELVAAHAARRDGLADLPLVAVELGALEEAVARVERVRDALLGRPLGLVGLQRAGGGGRGRGGDEADLVGPESHGWVRRAVPERYRGTAQEGVPRRGGAHRPLRRGGS
mmetsp:Transcript_37823/g.85108  ORF Transcript_37823/g.85108 Transcript_37823/m.85108 type:complete len:397 (+) Transcript_37823:93-1283(+)